jgi:hypothetical protein
VACCSAFIELNLLFTIAAVVALLRDAHYERNRGATHPA